MTSYISLSILSMIAIIVVLPVGCNRQQKRGAQVDESLACGKSSKQIGKDIYYGTCQCKGTNHPEDTKCLKKDKEPDNEDKWRVGSCSKGVCKLKPLTKECQMVPPLPSGSPPPFGCAFFCDSANGKYGFFSEGTRCKHKKSRTEYVNGTCQRSGDKMVCSDVPLPPVC
uniref:Putative secreted protein n=1 Tax=Amblyomma triste TaxID=251400 RepID=A0A023G684_AMBTT